MRPRTPFAWDSVMKPLNVTKSPPEAGFALALTIVLMVAIGLLITGAITVGGYNVLANRSYERTSMLHSVALSGLELARARINGNPSIYPDSSYATLEDGVAVHDGAGEVIPGVKRWLYAGPTGLTTGQYGIYGSIVAVVRDDGGAQVVRRLQISQKSFARFVYFTDSEGGNIYFNGDEFWGPVHSNDLVKLAGYPSTWHNEFTTASTIQNASLGTYDVGYEENVAPIPMPEVADLNHVRAQATAGGTHFTGDDQGDMNEASTRIEFVAIDLNNDGDATDPDEGFFKVYQSNNEAWLSGSVDSDLRDNQNCGRWHSGTFVSAPNHPYGGVSLNSSVNNSASVCYLGGDERITNGFVANDGKGSWLPWTGTQAAGLAGRPDAGYLWPLARTYNPNFKSVIAVTGSVGVSGVLRGRVTIAATADVVILDDVIYATDPGTGTCQDLLGLFAGDDVTVSHNLMNGAQRPWSGKNHRTYSATKDEFLHMVILALDEFGAGDPGVGSTNDEYCESQVGGRGCLYITGGIIQSTRGVVGIGAYGYWKRYSWDACALSSPPPYFPTTGHFAKGQYYDVDPVGFSVTDYFAALTPTG